MPGPSWELPIKGWEELGSLCSLELGRGKGRFGFLLGWVQRGWGPPHCCPSLGAEGQDLSSALRLEATSCDFLGQEIPFQMDNPIVAVTRIH